jgi:hypothetical protein
MESGPPFSSQRLQRLVGANATYVVLGKPFCRIRTKLLPLAFYLQNNRDAHC